MKRLVSINIELEVWKKFRIKQIRKDKSGSQRIEELMKLDLDGKIEG